VLGGSIPQPPLVGRRVELATLEEIVRCLPGGGRLVVVEGEAGIGKSRLIEAAAQMGRDAGLTVLSSQAEQLETHRPFGAIIDCIGRERLGDRWDAWELGLDRAGERLFRVAEAMRPRPPGARPLTSWPPAKSITGMPYPRYSYHRRSEHRTR